MKELSIEEKKLLFKDLCVRLPYGVKCTTKSMWNGIYTIVGYKDNRFFLDCPIYEEGDDEWMIESIVPYLRPMSSMTEEEVKELLNIDSERFIFSSRHLTWYLDGEVVYYLNSHHFDYRGLIYKGLALEAPEGMYNINNE